MTEEKFNLLSDSLKEFGDLSGIIRNIRTGELVGGNQRTNFFKQDPDNVEITIPEKFDKPTKTGTVALGYITYKGEKFSYREVDWEVEKEERANILANKVSGTWDFDILANEFDMDLLLETGWTNEDLEFFDDEVKDGLTDDDEIPEVKETICKTGDLWLLGGHRVLCGDATKIEDVEKLMDGKKADILLTDPPYGELKIFTDKSKDKVGLDGWDKKGVKAKSYLGDYQNEGNFKIEPVLEIVDALGIEKMVIWGGNFFECLPVRNSWLCWDKTGGDRNMNTPFSDFELAWTTLGIPMRIYHFMWKGMVREGKRIERVHPTQKPVELSQWILEKWAKDVGCILDLFLGSGSTLIAAEKTGRICRGMEIDPHYCDVIVKRWEDYTGKTAELVIHN